jgi:hypothetical protein
LFVHVRARLRLFTIEISLAHWIENLQRDCFSVGLFEAFVHFSP